MARFNQKSAGTAPTKTTNLAGGAAYKQSSELELVSVLLTSFAQDQYYRKADDTFARLKQLIASANPRFVAQAAIYARTKFGMRSITHVAAAELAKHISGERWAKAFYNAVVFRPDDMLEIASYYQANCAEAAKNKRGKKGLTTAMKKGFATAINRFSKYQLAKYRGNSKEFKLVDLVNLVHVAPPDDEHKEAMAALVKNDLKSFDTWEAELTAAGQAGETEGEVTQLKAAAWRKLLKEKKLGYLALLRNLRNIMEQAPDVLDLALDALTTESFIKAPRSLIFPFQYLIAYKQFAAMHTKEGRTITKALADAIEISCANVKTLNFTGNTLVAVDNSGSMDAPVAKSEHMKRSELGALFGIVLAKAVNADIMEFGSRARYIPYNLGSNSMEFAARFHELNQVDHGTNFHAIFQVANKKYDRILVFSDMQGWEGGYSTPDVEVANYKARHLANPFIYSFDLAGYGTMQFKENKVFCLAGFSDKILTIMSMLEQDRNALVNEIKKVEF